MSSAAASSKRKAPPAGPRHWTKEEDALLKQAVDKYGPRQWKMLARYVPSRSHTQCLQRWNKVLKPGLLKGPWSADEDHLLRCLVEQSVASLEAAAASSSTALDSCESDARVKSMGHKTYSSESVLTAASAVSAMTSGDSDDAGSAFGSLSDLPASKRIDWVLIAENIPGRSVKQCRERWCSNLDPAIRKGDWSPEEDHILLDTQTKHGNCWAHIARLLPGRTEHAVKTRFRSIMRARRREWSAEEDALLLEQHKLHGSNWAKIARPFNGRRTKNGLMTRFKQLQGPMEEEFSQPSLQSEPRQPHRSSQAEPRQPQPQRSSQAEPHQLVPQAELEAPSSAGSAGYFIAPGLDLGSPVSTVEATSPSEVRDSLRLQDKGSFSSSSGGLPAVGEMAIQPPEVSGSSEPMAETCASPPIITIRANPNVLQELNESENLARQENLQALQRQHQHQLGQQNHIEHQLQRPHAHSQELPSLHGTLNMFLDSVPHHSSESAGHEPGRASSAPGFAPGTQSAAAAAALGVGGLMNVWGPEESAADPNSLFARRKNLLKRYSDSWGGEFSDGVKDSILSLLDLDHHADIAKIGAPSRAAGAGASVSQGSAAQGTHPLMGSRFGSLALFSGPEPSGKRRRLLAYPSSSSSTSSVISLATLASLSQGQSTLG